MAGSRDGAIFTFYSYKGGVGRTQALANVAVLLARWGYRVLCIDWDLEAPGLHLYLDRFLGGRLHDGVVELITSVAEDGVLSPWQSCVVELDAPGPGRLDLMPAGYLDDTYPARMRELDWEQLYDEDELGVLIEDLRDQLRDEYDFVLVDSRTGITDIGGVCAVQLPDVLVALCTASHQSLDGVIDVVARAAAQRQRLPYERAQVPVLPVITRFEATVEVQLSQQWMRLFEERLGRLVCTWVHREVQTADLLPLMRIPHVAHWSFGEQLPVLDEGTSDPAGIGYAFETLAALVANRLEHSELLVANRRAFVATAASRMVGDEFEFDAFVSSSADERAYAAELAGLLRGHGLEVLGPDTLELPGTTFSARDRLARARNLVLVVGGGSPAVELEARDFLRASATELTPRRLIPVLRGRADRLPDVAAQYVYVDARGAAIGDVALRVARSIQEQLLETHESIRGFADPEALAAAHRLADTLLKARDWTAAVELLQRMARELRESEPPPDELVGVLSSLAFALNGLGRYGEALQVAGEALDRSESLPSSPRDRGDVLEVMAAAARGNGERARARELAERLVVLREEELGEEHPSTLRAVVAALDVGLDRGGAVSVALAEGLQERCVAACGPNHPTTLAAGALLARALAAAGEPGRALEQIDRVLERRRATLGPEHPSTLAAMREHAAYGRMAGGTSELELVREAVDVATRVLGPEHPDTLAALTELARTRFALGEAAEAQALHERILVTRRSALGPEHPDTLDTMASLAAVALALGQFDTALALAPRVLELRRAALGEDHPDTLAAEHQLAGALLAAGDAVGALPVAEHAHATYLRELGEDDVRTLDARATLVAVKRALGDPEARSLAEWVLVAREQMLGPSHPVTLAAAAELAITEQELGDFAAAKLTDERTVALLAEAYGEHDLRTAAAMARLALAHRHLDNHMTARELQQRVLDTRMALLGPSHRDTILATVQLVETLRALGEGVAAAALLRRLERTDAATREPPGAPTGA